MNILEKIFKELKSIARTAAYFAVVFLLMMVMKTLYLKDYNIEFSGISQALIGALILSKVIILMELISLGAWVQRQPPVVDICLRTLLYSAGVLVVVLLEKSFEKMHEAGGFGNAVSFIVSHRDMYHVWAATIGTSASILMYNALTVVQQVMGKNGLARLFFSTPLSQVEQFTPNHKG